MDNLKLECEVLEYHSKPFIGRDGKSVDYQYALVRAGGQVFKLTTKRNLSDFVDKECVLLLEIVVDSKLLTKIRVVGVE